MTGRHAPGNQAAAAYTHRMDVRDLGSHSAIGQLAALLRDVSRATDPMQIQRAFGANTRSTTGADAYISLSRRGLGPGEYKVTRAQFGSEVGTAYANPWEQWAQIPVHRGGILGRLIETSTPKLVTSLDVPNDPVLGDRLRPYGALVAAPLFDGGETLNWGLVLRLKGQPFTEEDAEEFFLRGNLIGGMTRNLLVAKQVRELNARLTAQLEEIAQIQRSLLPQELPKIPGVSLAASYLTSNEAGGDYYDFFDLGRDRWGVIIADVAGHGAGAATVMAMLQTILHGYEGRVCGPAATLAHANRALRAKGFESSFVTAFMGVMDTREHTLVYANAGHQRPKLRRGDGNVAEIDGASSLPLGIIDEAEYVEGMIELHPRDTVVLYTDGITEAFSPPPAREMFGPHRLTEALVSCSGEPQCVIDSIHQKLYDFTHSRERQDDQTIVALRVEQ